MGAYTGARARRLAARTGGSSALHPNQLTTTSPSSLPLRTARDGTRAPSHASLTPSARVACKRAASLPAGTARPARTRAPNAAVSAHHSTRPAFDTATARGALVRCKTRNAETSTLTPHPRRDLIAPS